MASKEANYLLILILNAALFGNGCALLPENLKATTPILSEATQTDGETEQIDVNTISIDVVTEGVTHSIEFPGQFTNLGKVISSLDSVPMSPVTSVNRGNQVIFIPTYYALNTDAAKIAIEDGDSIRFVNWSSSPIANDEPIGLTKIRKTLVEEFEFPEDGNIDEMRIASFIRKFELKVKKHKKISDSTEQVLIESKDKLSKLNQELIELKNDTGSVPTDISAKESEIDAKTTEVEASVEKLKTDIQDLKKIEANLSRFRSLGIGYDKEVKSFFTGSYRLEGLLEVSGQKKLDDISTIDDLFSKNKIAGIKNSVPANIIVLKRGNTLTVLPLRKELRNAVVPQEVKLEATDAYLKTNVKDGDVFQFTRLSLFAPVVDGLRKELSKKINDRVNKKVSGIAKDAVKNSENYYKKLEEQSRRREPGPIQKALRSFPNQLPDFNIPGFRLPGF